MRGFRVGGIKALLMGACDGCSFDPAFDGLYGQPAIIPEPVFPGPVVPETDPSFSYSGTWTAGATVTPGSSFSFSYVGVACQFLFSGGPQGGIAFVTLDGAPRLAVDTYQPTGGTVGYVCPSPRYGPHTAVVTYYGDLNQEGVFATTPANGTGTSVAPLLSFTRDYRGQTAAGTHTIRALSSSTVSIDGSGSYGVGTSVDGVIPGLAVNIASGTLTTGDTATFTTYATGITVQGAEIATTGSSTATFQTPIIDPLANAYQTEVSVSGAISAPLFLALFSTPGLVTETMLQPPLPLPFPDPDTTNVALHWTMAFWEEDPANPVTDGWCTVGNSLRPSDPESWWITMAKTDWTPQYLKIGHMTRSDGTGIGMMGLGPMPKALFCRVGLNIPPLGFARGLRIYGWDEDTDGDRDRFPMVPDDDLTRRILGALIASYCYDVRDYQEDAHNSFSFGTAVGKWLDARGLEWGIARPYGMDDEGFSLLLRFLSQSHSVGATENFCNNALALILGPGIPFSIHAKQTTTLRWVLGTSRLGVDTYLGPKTIGKFQATIAIDVSALTLPPQTVETLMRLFRPVGVSTTFLWQ